jgi:hypothetical protein
MEEAQSEPANHRDPGVDPPLTLELLADLQAGLLDDEDAARVRRQIRANPQAQGMLRALNQIRHDVAAVAADPASEPGPPPDVAAKISTALRSANAPSGRSHGAAHLARPRIRPARVVAAVAGLGAALTGIGLGTAALIRAPAPTPSTPVTAEHITVSIPPMMIPLSRGEILGLLRHNPDYGTLADPQRRASCLSGLGYPASTPVLGARPIELNSRPGILLVLPGDAPENLAVFAVSANCNAADTGLLANTQVPRA